MEDIKHFKLYGLYDIKIDDLDLEEDKKLYNPNHRKGQIEVSDDLEELDKWNFYDYYGIFQTVNEYDNERKTEKLTKINYWFCDLDSKFGDSKKAMLLRLASTKKRPTFIVETKNGFHCYWQLKNPIIVTDENRADAVERFKAIEEGLVKRFNADPARTDAVGLLRYPYRLHWKKPSDPYAIRYLYDDPFNEYWDFNPENPESKYKLESRSGLLYNEKEMIDYFAIPKKQVQKSNKSYTNDKSLFFDETKWDDLFGLSTGTPRRYKNGDIVHDENGNVVYKKSLSLIGDGNRNNNLARIALWLRDEHLTNQDIAYIVRTINSKYIKPSLSEREVTQILRGKKIYD